LVFGVKIGELSQRAEIPARMLRYYEAQGLITPRRLGNGYRDYDGALVERAEKIKCFVAAGVPLRAIGPILAALENPGDVPLSEISAKFGSMLVRERQRMAGRVASLETNLTALTELLKTMGIDENVSEMTPAPPAEAAR
jgi:DNA-binding transcriptional MerR regulator